MASPSTSTSLSMGSHLLQVSSYVSYEVHVDLVEIRSLVAWNNQHVVSKPGFFSIIIDWFSSIKNPNSMFYNMRNMSVKLQNPNLFEWFIMFVNNNVRMILKFIQVELEIILKTYSNIFWPSWDFFDDGMQPFWLLEIWLSYLRFSPQIDLILLSYYICVSLLASVNIFNTIKTP